MTPKIEHPRVFISYAWGTKEYQAKVLSLATDLVRDGIEVEFDKWSLHEGNDTYAFMEQSATDTSITNVLILLDEQYAKKADERKGGVGTETQIISPEIYTKVKQDKFLPVIFERGKDGEVYKPTYLKGLLHFDLSLAEGYDDEYQRLVKRLYGIEIYQKPTLGKQPSWIDSTPTVSAKVLMSISFLKSNLSSQEKREKLLLTLEQQRDRIVNYNYGEDLNGLPLEKYLEAYAGTTLIRNEFLQMVQPIASFENGERFIADMLEETSNLINHRNGITNGIRATLLHEIFIYIIGIYVKTRNYKALSYTLGKTYFSDGYSGDRTKNYDIFYNARSENLDNALKKRDDKNYHSGTAQYWIENIYVEACSVSDFVFADLLCFNYSVFGKEYRGEWHWFPKTYVYENENNSRLRAFAIKLKSIEHLSIAAQVFGYEDADGFKNKFTEIESNEKGKFREYRYNSAFDCASLLSDFIKSSELGLLK